MELVKSLKRAKLILSSFRRQYGRRIIAFKICDEDTQAPFITVVVYYCRHNVPTNIKSFESCLFGCLINFSLQSAARPN